MSFRAQDAGEYFSYQDPLSNESGWSISDNYVFSDHPALKPVWDKLRAYSGNPFFLDKPHKNESPLPVIRTSKKSAPIPGI
jgi:hypothetical protein